MAAPNIYANGIGGPAGDELVTAPRLITSGSVWYVGNASGGVDSSSAGRDRQRPFASLSYALTQATHNDIVTCMENHYELIDLTNAIGINQRGLTVAGEGHGATRPAFVRVAATVMWDNLVEGITISNIRFPAAPAAGDTGFPKVRARLEANVFHNCWFEGDRYDRGYLLQIGLTPHQFRLEGTTFVSVATSSTTQPLGAFDVTDATNDLWMEDVVFDGGDYGWSNQHAWNTDAVITRLKGINVRFAGGGAFLTSGTTGYIAEKLPSGGMKVVWAA